MGSVPRIPRNPPSSESSPTITKSSSSRLFSAPYAPRIPKRHRQIEARTFFLDVGRRKIDGDVGRRNVVSAVLEGRAHAFAAFANGCIRQSHGREVVFGTLDAGNVYFYFNDVGVDTVYGRAERFKQQVRTPSRKRKSLPTRGTARLCPESLRNVTPPPKARWRAGCKVDRPSDSPARNGCKPIVHLLHATLPDDGLAP